MHDFKDLFHALKNVIVHALLRHPLNTAFLWGNFEVKTV